MRILDANEWRPKKDVRVVAQQQHLLSQRIQPISINNLSTGVPQNVNILQARRGPQRVTRLPNGKRRIQPISLNPLNGSANPASTAAVSVTQTQTQILPPTPLKLNGSAADVFAAAVDQPLENQSRVNQLRDDMAQHTSTGYSEMTRSTTTFVTEQDDINGSADRADKRRRTSTDGDWEPQSRYIRGRTLGGGEKSTRDSQPQQPVRELIPMMKSAGPLPSSSSSTAGGEPVVRLPLPIVQTLLRSSSEDDHSLVVEGENSDDGEHCFRVSMHMDALPARNKKKQGLTLTRHLGTPSRVTMNQNGRTQWLDFPPLPIIALAISSHGVLCGLQGGSLIGYSPSGTRSVASHLLGRFETKISDGVMILRVLSL